MRSYHAELLAEFQLLSRAFPSGHHVFFHRRRFLDFFWWIFIIPINVNLLGSNLSKSTSCVAFIR
jgi:hypothetical protein